MKNGTLYLLRELKEKEKREDKRIPIEWQNAMDDARRMEGELDLRGDKKKNKS